MGTKKRTYEIKEVLTGNPPKPQPILTEDNKVIPPTEKIIFNKNTDHMKKIDHYRIRFDIKDFGNSRLRFVPTKADAMWVHTGNSCPTSPCAMPNVFWVDDLDKDGEWIDVINMDLVVEDFWFTLNFVDKSIVNPTQSDYVPLDPGGGNQNNGAPGSDLQASFLPALAVGCIAGLVTFFGARLLLTG